MNARFSQDEIDALTALVRSPDREAPIHKRLIHYKLARCGVGRPWGPYVAVTKFGFQWLQDRSHSGSKGAAGESAAAKGRRFSSKSSTPAAAAVKSLPREQAGNGPSQTSSPRRERQQRAPNKRKAK